MNSGSPSRQRGTPLGEGGGKLVGEHVFVLDRVRIEVALERRIRYRYVHPRVLREGEGWRIVSPNCSRNVTRDGGDIDIALLMPAPTADLPDAWMLHARDHARSEWMPRLRAPSLDAALQRLVTDPDRMFWQ